MSLSTTFYVMPVRYNIYTYSMSNHPDFRPPFTRFLSRALTSLILSKQHASIKNT